MILGHYRKRKVNKVREIITVMMQVKVKRQNLNSLQIGFVNFVRKAKILIKGTNKVNKTIKQIRTKIKVLNKIDYFKRTGYLLL